MIHVHHAHFNTTREVDLLNVTHDVARALRESQILNGLLTVYVPGSTAGVVILENDKVIHDEFKNMIASFVPESSGPRPSRRSGSGHLENHLRAALLHQSVSIPVKDGRLMTGPWQEVWAIDFDDKVGRRELLVHVMGEGAEKKK